MTYTADQIAAHISRRAAAVGENSPDVQILRQLVAEREAAWADALPDLVKPLVWLRNGDHYAGGYGFIIRKQGNRFVLTCRNGFPETFDTLESAKAAAQAHHVAQVMQAFTA